MYFTNWYLECLSSFFIKADNTFTVYLWSSNLFRLKISKYEEVTFQRDF